MPSATPPSPTARTQRLLHASPAQVFAAIRDPQCLARWWGPAGFSNQFQAFDFREGGRWEFVMRGPDGTEYPNACEFRVIAPDRQVVIDHVVAPRFTLTLTLTAQGPQATQTLLDWQQTFENAEMAERLRPIVEPANEQNLDRLEAVLLPAP